MTKPRNAKARRSARDRVKDKKPSHIDVPLALDQTALDTLVGLRVAVDQARTRVELANLAKADDDNRDERIAAAEVVLAEADAALADFAVDNADIVMVFRVQAIGRPDFDALLLAHQPDDETRAKLGQEGATGDGLLWHPETFPRALVAESLAGEVTHDDDGKEVFDAFAEDDAADIVDDIWDSGNWSPAETGALFMASYALATQRRAVPDLGKASRPTRSSATS